MVGAGRPCYEVGRGRGGHGECGEDGAEQVSHGGFSGAIIGHGFASKQAGQGPGPAFARLAGAALLLHDDSTPMSLWVPIGTPEAAGQHMGSLELIR